MLGPSRTGHVVFTVSTELGHLALYEVQIPREAQKRSFWPPLVVNVSVEVSVHSLWYSSRKKRPKLAARQFSFPGDDRHLFVVRESESSYVLIE
jgi:hypothetical protein